MKKVMTFVVILLLLLVVATTALFLHVRHSIDKIETQIVDAQNANGDFSEEELTLEEILALQEALAEEDIFSEFELPVWQEREPRDGDFKGNRIDANRKKFEMVMSYDLENDYPRTPEDVIRQYSEVYNVIYGNFIQNEELILELVRQQRRFFATSLLEANSLEEQFIELMQSLFYLSEIDFYYIGHRQEEAQYDQNLNSLVTIDVVHYSRIRENFRISYLLELDPDTKRWKIKGWDIQKEEL